MYKRQAIYSCKGKPRRLWRLAVATHPTIMLRMVGPASRNQERDESCLLYTSALKVVQEESDMEDAGDMMVLRASLKAPKGKAAVDALNKMCIRDRQ